MKAFFGKRSACLICSFPHWGSNKHINYLELKGNNNSVQRDVSAAIQSGRWIWTLRCNFTIHARCCGPVEHTGCWKHEAQCVRATLVSIGATCMEGCMLLEPDSPAASFASHCRGQTVQEGGKRDKRYSRHLKWEKLINTCLLAIGSMIYWNQHFLLSWKSTEPNACEISVK